MVVEARGHRRVSRTHQVVVVEARRSPAASAYRSLVAWASHTPAPVVVVLVDRSCHTADSDTAYLGTALVGKDCSLLGRSPAVQDTTSKDSWIMALEGNKITVWELHEYLKAQHIALHRIPRGEHLL